MAGPSTPSLISTFLPNSLTATAPPVSQTTRTTFCQGSSFTMTVGYRFSTDPWFPNMANSERLLL